MIRIWRYLQDHRSGTIQKSFLEHLRGRGVESFPLNIQNPVGPGIIFFSEADDETCSVARDISHGGRERVLAVSLSALPPNRIVWQLLAAGASDVLPWGDPPQLAAEVAARFQRWSAVDEILHSSMVRDNLIGQSRAWQSVLRQVIEVAHFTDAPVLLTGDSGTGKELVARLIHTLDPRQKKKDLVVLDCTTIVPALSGSEFFGHERGAFTGAVATREGAFSLADGGTLFLDEIGELPLDLQAQLLRVIQEQTYKRVGGNTWFKTEFRLICATNRSLIEMVREGKFRHDLYHRITSWTFRLPPLRERREDIIPLARYFMQQEYGKGEAPELGAPVRDFLLLKEYPGNVRELKQLATRIMQKHVGRGTITAGAIPREELPSSAEGIVVWNDHHFERSIHAALQLGVGLKEIGRVAEDTAVRLAVRTEEGNLQRAARKLGVTDRALQLRRANRRENGSPLEIIPPPSCSDDHWTPSASGNDPQEIVASNQPLIGE